MYKFKIPFLPPSVNKLYSWNPRTHSVYMTEEGRHYKMAIKLACPPMTFKSKNPIIDIACEYHSPKWICRNGNIRKADGMNLDKICYDAIAEKIGVDDSHFFIWIGRKIVDKDEYALIIIREIDDEQMVSELQEL